LAGQESIAEAPESTVEEPPTLGGLLAQQLLSILDETEPA